MARLYWVAHAIGSDAVYAGILQWQPESKGYNKDGLLELAAIHS